MADRVIEELSVEQCLNLISAGGIGRIAYTGRFGPAVLPVNYAVQDGAVVFRTATNGPLDEDLRTGITDADYKVAFEIDSIDLATRQGWSVLIQGPAHRGMAGQCEGLEGLAGPLGAEILRDRALDVVHGDRGAPAAEARCGRSELIGDEQIGLQPLDRGGLSPQRQQDKGRDVQRQAPEHPVQERRQIGAEQRLRP